MSMFRILESGNKERYVVEKRLLSGQDWQDITNMFTGGYFVGTLTEAKDIIQRSKDFDPLNVVHTDGYDLKA